MGLTLNKMLVYFHFSMDEMVLVRLNINSRMGARLLSWHVVMFPLFISTTHGWYGITAYSLSSSDDHLNQRVRNQPGQDTIKTYQNTIKRTEQHPMAQPR